MFLSLCLQVTKLYSPPMKEILHGNNLLLIMILGGIIGIGYLLDLIGLGVKKRLEKRSAIKSAASDVERTEKKGAKEKETEKKEVEEKGAENYVTVPEQDLLDIKAQMLVIERLVNSTLKTHNS